MTQINPLEEQIANFERLNEKFIELCCHYYRQRAKIPDALNKYMEEAFFEEYKQHYTVHASELADVAETTIYILDEMHGVTTPHKRRWFQFWKPKTNESSKKIDETIGLYIEQFMDELRTRVDNIAENFTTALRQMLALDTSGAPCATANETPSSEKTSQRPEPPTEQTPAPSPAPAPQKPAETWEEEHAFPSKTLANPSER